MPEMKDTMPILTDFRMTGRRKTMYEYSCVYNASMNDRNVQRIERIVPIEAVDDKKNIYLVETRTRPMK